MKLFKGQHIQNNSPN